MSFGTISLRSSQVTVTAERDGDQVALGVFIEGFSETKEHHYEQMAYLMLDEAGRSSRFPKYADWQIAELGLADC